MPDRDRGSQYPHRRASSWRLEDPRLLQAGKLSQYPHRRASSWRWKQKGGTNARFHRLNTLTGGHPLGGWRRLAPVGPVRPTSQYPHRRASSWRLVGSSWHPTKIPRLNTLTGGHPLGGGQTVVVYCGDPKSLNTLTGGHPLGGDNHLIALKLPPKVSIPSQAGILLAVS